MNMLIIYALSSFGFAFVFSSLYALSQRKTKVKILFLFTPALLWTIFGILQVEAYFSMKHHMATGGGMDFGYAFWMMFMDDIFFTLCGISVLFIIFGIISLYKDKADDKPLHK